MIIKKRKEQKKRRRRRIILAKKREERVERNLFVARIRCSANLAGSALEFAFL
jgi:hypothetical protein